MTTYIAFHNAARDSGYAVIDGLSLVSEEIAEDGTNKQSLAATRPFVTIHPTVDVWAAFGLNPNALTQTTTRIRLAAGIPRTIGIGIGDKVAITTG